MATCNWGYSRRAHLIGLISAFITYLMLIAALFFAKDDRYFVSGGMSLVLLNCILLWWLRGSYKFSPKFFNFTLNIEFVYHSVPLVVFTCLSGFYLRSLLDEFHVRLLVVTLAFTLAALAHAMLVFVTLAVPYVLLRGSAEQKAELATQVVSGVVVNLPEDKTGLSRDSSSPFTLELRAPPVVVCNT